MKRILQILLSLLAVFLTACNFEGVAGFSPTNDRVAIVTKVGGNYHLYATDASGGSPLKIEDNIAPGFDITFDPFGQKLLYSAGGQVCTANAADGTKSCPFATPGGVAGGFLSYLPDGDFILAYATSGHYQMNVYAPGAAVPKLTEINVDQFFLTSDAYKVRRGTNGANWTMNLYEKPSGQRNLRWVITRGNQAIMYNASGSLEGPTPLPRDINSAVQTALHDRDQTDITSGVVSPDGTKLVFRTRTGSAPNYSYGLYALDLAVNTGSFIQLVNNASFRIQFAFSPNGQELVYESNDAGQSVWLANSDGTQARKLADNASLPSWH